MGAPSMGGAAPQPAAVETRYCSECGRPYPANQLYAMGTGAVCAACYPAYMQRMGAGAPMQQATAAPGAWHYGGFWIRFLARVIDAILLGIVGTIIRIPLALIMGTGSLLSLGRIDQDNPAAALAALGPIFALAGLSFVIQVALTLVYEVYFLTTRGATVGKMALGLKVVRVDGGPISMGLAVGRFFASYLSGIIFFIGYIIAGFDIEKRSLHDRICNTRVIYTR
jgi:uncharacterized RDD family membrane protein YckC